MENARQKSREFIRALWQLRQWRKRLERNDYIVIKLKGGGNEQTHSGFYRAYERPGQ